MPSLQIQNSMDGLDALVSKIAQSGVLGQSRRRKQLLYYLLKEELSGRGERLKAYSIAIDVLGRDADFDPGQDSIVRVEVGRLRDALERFYARDDSVGWPVVTIPKGGYRPTIAGAFPIEGANHPPHVETNDHHKLGPSSVTKTRHRMAKFVIVALLSAGLATFAFAIYRTMPSTMVADRQHTSFQGPKVAVAQFENLGASDQDSYIATGMSVDLIRELSRFSWLTVFNDRDALPGKNEAGFDYLIRGATRLQGGDTLRLTLQLIEFPGGAVLWSDDTVVRYTASDIVAAQIKAAENVATLIGQPYGVISKFEHRRVSRSVTDATDAYLCVMQVYQYYQSLSHQEHANSRECLEASLKSSPEFAEAHAALAFLYLDEVRFGINRRPNTNPLERAEEEAERAYLLNPLSTAALQARYTLYAHNRDFDSFNKIGQIAVSHAGNDPELLADFGNKLALYFGRWDEGLAFIQRARQMNPDPRGTYSFARAHYAFKTGACKSVDTGVLPQSARQHFIGAVLILACAAEVDDRQGAVQAIKSLSDLGYSSRNAILDTLSTALLDREHSARLAMAIEEAFDLVTPAGN